MPTGHRALRKGLVTLPSDLRLSPVGSFQSVTDPDDAYIAREAKARKKIDTQLRAAGWIVPQTASPVDPDCKRTEPSRVDPSR